MSTCAIRFKISQGDCLWVCRYKNMLICYHKYSVSRIPLYLNYLFKFAANFILFLLFILTISRDVTVVEMIAYAYQ